DEFRDELAALGVDVDALKRDVAALSARVDALEAEQNRVRITGVANVFAIATSNRSKWEEELEGDIVVDRWQPNAYDMDSRLLGDKLMRNIAVIKDFDLTITGRVSNSTTAVAMINYGDYLNYLGSVDSYSSQTMQADSFFPYCLYIDTALGSKGKLTVGRFPIQWTPYTLKKIDVDSYTSNIKTDDGNYMMDGAKLGCNFGGVDLTLFAAKNDQNNYFAAGLASQAGLMSNHFIGGTNVGGLKHEVTQTAGARAEIGTPGKGILGLSFYQAWTRDSSYGPAFYLFDQARVYGADLNIPFGNFGFAGNWTKSDTLAVSGTGYPNVKDKNTAWDGKLTGNFGSFGIGAGYKHIGRNFAAAGAWDKIGRWTNPTNIKGPYVDINIPIA
ncbi:MAG: hypothetical protein GX139_01390, partial [Armatimonadetes bacterium]|nr:hypothetical protein [Armatimonadota bacterium]